VTDTEMTTLIVGLRNAADILRRKPSDVYRLEQLCREAADFIEQRQADYDQAYESHLSHVRDLDVAMNGEDGAAKRPLLIDIKHELLDCIRRSRPSEREAVLTEWHDARKAFLALPEGTPRLAALDRLANAEDALFKFAARP
jgi:hypothetical protein